MVLDIVFSLIGIPATGTVIFWTELSCLSKNDWIKATLLLDQSHCCNLKTTVDVTNWSVLGTCKNKNILPGWLTISQWRLAISPRRLIISPRRVTISVEGWGALAPRLFACAPVPKKMPLSSNKGHFFCSNCTVSNFF